MNWLISTQGKRCANDCKSSCARKSHAHALRLLIASGFAKLGAAERIRTSYLLLTGQAHIHMCFDSIMGFKLSPCVLLILERDAQGVHDCLKWASAANAAECRRADEAPYAHCAYSFQSSLSAS